MAMAIIKATLVGWYFMHLKFEGRWVYFMLVPAGILATIFVLALYPDIGMQPISEQPAERGGGRRRRSPASPAWSPAVVRS